MTNTNTDAHGRDARTMPGEKGMTMTNTEQLEAEVRQSMATDPHYPLGERDAMKWAVAFRLRITDANLEPDPADDDVFMCGWFANCMATGEMAASGGSFLNADGMQSIIDGEMEPHPELMR